MVIQELEQQLLQLSSNEKLYIIQLLAQSLTIHSTHPERPTKLSEFFRQSPLAELTEELDLSRERSLPRYAYQRNIMSKTPKIDRIREHLANERTFLAWMRTSIALIGFGFAIARFALFLRSMNPIPNQQQSARHAFLNSENLGLALVLFGILTVAMAAWRYNQVFWQIERSDYQHNRLMVWIMTGVVMFFGFLSIPLLLRRNSTSPSFRIPPSQSRNDFSQN